MDAFGQDAGVLLLVVRTKLYKCDEFVTTERERTRSSSPAAMSKGFARGQGEWDGV